LVSLAALVFNQRAWLETNRPIVTAEIIPHDEQSHAITYELVVQNVGNRPATDVRLIATPEAIKTLVQPNASEPFRKEVERCFSDEGRIAVLHPGMSKSNGFGLTSISEAQNALVYGASAPIEIRYKDLRSRSYTSNLALIIKGSYFAGSGWG
jgi:hypothetical protein